MSRPRVYKHKTNGGRPPYEVFYPNGDRYEGSIDEKQYYVYFKRANIVFHGHGSMTYHTGDVYVGNWLHGQKHFNGTMTFANGNMYVGTWARDRQETGHMSYATGDTYDGQWRNNLPHGDGRFFHKETNRVYNGTWKYGVLRQIKGVRYSNGDVYTGKFSDDGMFYDRVRHGRGKCVYADGSVYDGKWKNDVYHGQGTLTTLSSRTNDTGHVEKSGVWEYGELKTGIMKLVTTVHVNLLNHDDPPPYYTPPDHQPTAEQENCPSDLPGTERDGEHEQPANGLDHGLDHVLPTTSSVQVDQV